MNEEDANSGVFTHPWPQEHPESFHEPSVEPGRRYPCSWKRRIHGRPIRELERDYYLLRHPGAVGGTFSHQMVHVVKNRHQKLAEAVCHQLQTFFLK